MKKKLILLFVFLFILSSLNAIGFGYHILKLRTNQDFGLGMFPTSLTYQFNFPVPDFIKDNSTSLAFRLDNGTDFRRLYQNPDNGEWIDSNPELLSQFTSSKERNYTTQFDEFTLVFEQGLFGKYKEGSDLVKLHFSFGGRFEIAFERWGWMSNQYNTSGLFWKEPGELRFPDSSFVGTPELRGDRDVFQTFFTLAFELNLMEGRLVNKSGFKLQSWVRVGEPWVFLNDKESSDFTLSWNKIEFCYTPFVIKQKNNRELSYFSFTVGTEFIYRYINGTKVPYYIESGDIFGLRAMNTEHLLTNRTYFTIFGPELHNEDFYPSFKVFHDAALSAGKLLNSDENKTNLYYYGSFGWRAEWNLYNIATLYYEEGYTYFVPFEKKELNRVKMRLGFTLEF